MSCEQGDFTQMQLRFWEVSEQILKEDSKIQKKRFNNGFFNAC